MPRRFLALAGWALLGPWKVWLAFGVPIAALFAVVALPMGDAEQRVRSAGVLMTLAGVGLVARGIADTRRMFGRQTYLQRLVGWLTRRPHVFAPRAITMNVGSASLGLSGHATMTVSAAVRNLSTVEGRLQALEDDVRRINERIARTEAELRGEIATVRSTASAEATSRAAGDDRLMKLLEDVAAGGLDFEAVGVVWLIAGEVFGSFPAEIATRLPG